MVFHITEAEDGRILRSFLKETLGISSHTLANLKRRPDGITLNGVTVTVRAVLHTGDVLALAVEDDESNEDVLPCPIPIKLLYEDEAIAVCQKPENMPTHPSHGHFEDTLANALAYLYRDRPFIFRAITRLDRETSGAVLVAKDAISAQRLSLAMQEGRIRKCYFALTYGKTPSSGEVTFPIRRKEGSIILREIHPEGAEAKTLYTRLYTDGSHSLLAVFPLTGRTHQIRLHLASLGHPILGDCLYGREGDGFPRTMLHAATLTFPHPTNGNTVSVFAPVSDDFREILSSLSFPLPTENDTFADEPHPTALFDNVGERGE